MTGIALLVCGSRDASWPEVAHSVSGAIIEAADAAFDQETGRSNVCLVHGAADGADAVAGQIAQYRKVSVLSMPALWSRPDGSIDRSAGHRRNAQMTKVLEALAACGWEVRGLAFPRGASPGTRNMIERFERQFPGCMVVHELVAEPVHTGGAG